MMRDMNLLSQHIETHMTSMFRTITKKCTLRGMILRLMFGEGTKKRVASAVKSKKERIIWYTMIEKLTRR